MAALLSIATAVPRHRYPQSDILARARGMFQPKYPAFHVMEPVFSNAGIDWRHLALPLDWYLETKGWRERMGAYVDVASSLFIDAARAAIAQAGLTPADIDAVITISSTGIAAPSLEARVAGEIGFRANIRRMPIFGLGCAGGVTGLANAARLAEAAPGSNVLLVAVELCSLSFRLDQMTKANIVATALFGDGAAACVVRAGDGGLATISGGAEHSWPNTLDIMGWSIDDEGLGVIFDRSIPPFAQEHIPGAAAVLLAELGLKREDVGRFIFHPGGTKVLEALESCLDLGPGSLFHERAVLRDYGNMSAPTALFVLDRAIAAGLPARSVLMALGPGFTLSAVALASPT